MDPIRIAGLASVGFAVLVEPALAGAPAPGPIAGVGLPALVLIGGAYWWGESFLARKIGALGVILSSTSPRCTFGALVCHQLA